MLAHPLEETPVAYWKRLLHSAETLDDLRRIWMELTIKGGRYYDFTASEQKELKATKDERKVALGRE